MPWLVAVNFSSLSILAFSRELKPITNAQCVPSSLCSRKASFRVSSSMCIKKFTAADSLDAGYVANVPSSDVFVQFPFHSDVSHCSRTLTGYWIGPDTDDGWGFVEAVLDDIV
ncbi:unnamed protein product [Amaranthus hypochondriacus]